MRPNGWHRGGHGRDELTCHELVMLVTDYLEGALDERDRRRFEDHLRGCDGCTEYLEQVRQTIQIAGRVEVEDLDPAARTLLLEAFRGWWRTEKADTPVE